MTKKILIRIGIVVVIVGMMGFSDWSFAADNGSNEVMKDVAYVLKYLIDCLAWIWVFFANMAGTFLTNNWIYAERFGLDVLLWKFWNLMKNFANFGLGFYFVYVVLKGLFSSDIIKNLKNNLLWILIAGVGIQASWFFTAVVLDVSSVAMAAAGSFPSMMISQNETVQSSFEKFKDLVAEPGGDSKKFNEGYKIHLFDSNSSTTDFLTVEKVHLDKGVSLRDYLDSITPNEKDVSGPLYYMGYSILKTTGMPSINDNSIETIKATIFNAILQGGTTIVFAIEMIVLCIAALIRMVYLWMFIFLSPVAVLIFCISQTGDNKLMKSSLIAPLWKHINFKTFFWNVFKPVIVVLGLGIAVILVSLMGNLMGNDNTGKEIDVGWVKFKSVKNQTTTGPNGDRSNEDKSTYNTSMESDFLGLYVYNAGKALLDFVLCIITILMVYYIVKIAMKMGSGDDFLSKRINKIQDDVGGIMSSLPVMPVKSYDKEGVETTRFIGARDVFGLSGEGSLLARKFDTYRYKMGQDDRNLGNSIVNSWFGVDNNKTTSLKPYDRDTISDIREANTGLNVLEKQFEKIKEFGNRPDSEGGLKSSYGYGMILDPNASDTWWQTEFGKWLKKMGETNTKITSSETPNYDIWNNMISRWNSEEAKKIEDKMKMQTMFDKVPNAIRAYAELFELGNITTWEELKVADISRKPG